jgi:hypothetical protein
MHAGVVRHQDLLGAAGRWVWSRRAGVQADGWPANLLGQGREYVAPYINID